MAPTKTGNTSASPPSLSLISYQPVTATSSSSSPYVYYSCFFFSFNTDFVTFATQVVEAYSQIPCVQNTEVNGRKGYDTNDIFAPHPTKPGLWRVYGRADDQIMHSTGEKVRVIRDNSILLAYAASPQTNPGPLGTLHASRHRDCPLTPSL